MTNSQTPSIDLLEYFLLRREHCHRALVPKAIESVHGMDQIWHLNSCLLYGKTEANVEELCPLAIASCNPFANAGFQQNSNTMFGNSINTFVMFRSISQQRLAPWSTVAREPLRMVCLH